jgi:hypothetical protein
MSHRGYPVTKAVKAMRRKAAEERLEAYNKKYPTNQAKLDALPTTGSSKQRARLQALVNEAKEKRDAKEKAVEVKSQNKKGNV